MNVLVLLLFTAVVVVVLALTMHRLIAFRSPTASLRRCDLRRTSPSLEVATLELGRVLRRGASDIAVSVVSVGALSSTLNGKGLPSFISVASA